MSPELRGHAPTRITTKEKILRPLAAAAIGVSSLIAVQKDNENTENAFALDSSIVLEPNTPHIVSQRESFNLRINYYEENVLGPEPLKYKLPIGGIVKDFDPEEEIRLQKEAEARVTAEREAEAKKKAQALPKPTNITAQAANETMIPIDGTDVWIVLADCESGDGQVGAPYYVNWAYDGPSGFDGAYQFLPSTWNSLSAATGYDYAWQAPPEVQTAVAMELQARGGWGQWPDCTNRMIEKGYIK